jgi:hypothetical protein
LLKVQGWKGSRHDLPKQFREFSSEWDHRITLQALKKEVDAFEEVDESVMVRDNIPYCLWV